MDRFALLAVGLFAVGCTGGDDTVDTDTDPPMFDVTLTGSNYVSQEGKMVHAVLLDESGAMVGAEPAPVAISIGVFGFKWTDVLDGQDYTVAWYVDVDGDNACDAPPADPGFTHVVSLAGDDVDYDHVWTTAFDAGACDAFAP